MVSKNSTIGDAPLLLKRGISHAQAQTGQNEKNCDSFHGYDFDLNAILLNWHIEQLQSTHFIQFFMKILARNW